MGLFVTVDGEFQGWLAALLCCCAAVNNDESPAARERERQQERVKALPHPEVCTTQPPPVTPLPSALSSQLWIQPRGVDAVDPHDIDDSPRHATPIRDSPPKLLPLDLGARPLLGRPSSQGRNKKSPLQGGTRPAIGAPHTFRRLDVTPEQRQSLVPLRLGPVVLRESPLPDDCSPMPRRIFNPRRNQSDPTLVMSAPSSFSAIDLRQRESPFERCQRRSSSLLPSPPPDLMYPRDFSRPSRPSLSTRSSNSSIRRHFLDTNTSPIASRPPLDRMHPKRKRSFPSAWRSQGGGESTIIDEEILELNTIVEERRAEAARSVSPTQHVAAIAPSMQVTARAETLNDIGSALSRPLTARETTSADPSLDLPEEAFVRRSKSQGGSRTSSRVSGWLSNIFPASANPPTLSDEPFYKCKPPPRARVPSDISLGSTIIELDSPSLTAASSPTSKGHSRSQTGESRIAAMPPLMAPYYYTHAHGDDDEVVAAHKSEPVGDRWPEVVSTPTSQVGLAI